MPSRRPGTNAHSNVDILGNEIFEQHPVLVNAELYAMRADDTEGKVRSRSESCICNLAAPCSLAPCGRAAWPRHLLTRVSVFPTQHAAGMVQKLSAAAAYYYQDGNRGHHFSASGAILTARPSPVRQKVRDIVDTGKSQPALQTHEHKRRQRFDYSWGAGSTMTGRSEDHHGGKTPRQEARSFARLRAIEQSYPKLLWTEQGELHPGSRDHDLSSENGSPSARGGATTRGSSRSALGLYPSTERAQSAESMVLDSERQNLERRLEEISRLLNNE